MQSITIPNSICEEVLLEENRLLLVIRKIE